MKISIIMAYYNRKKEFYETIKSISMSKFKDFELVVVDDCSSDEHRLEDYINEFPFMKIIRLELENKWYMNPCVPFNIGINNSIGEVIVIQNPECLHVHDVLTYINDNINDDKYISISTYSLDEEQTNKLPSLNNYELIKYFNKLPQISASDSKNYLNCWINHSKYMPFCYHYCSVITRKNIDLLGGFDERYHMGISCDDDEFIIRVGRLGLEKIIVDDISVIHQYHKNIFKENPNHDELVKKNRNILNNITKKKMDII